MCCVCLFDWLFDCVCVFDCVCNYVDGWVGGWVYVVFVYVCFVCKCERLYFFIYSYVHHNFMIHVCVHVQTNAQSHTCMCTHTHQYFFEFLPNQKLTICKNYNFYNSLWNQKPKDGLQSTGKIRHQWTIVLSTRKDLDIIPESKFYITTPYAATENCLWHMSMRHFQGRYKYLSELLLVAWQCSVEPSHPLQFLSS